MIKKATFLTAMALAVVVSSPSVHAGELLVNGNFEAPALSGNGDHAGYVPTNWIVGSSAGATTSSANLSNIEVGTITTGTGVTSPSQYLAVCPDDTTPGAMQSLDGVGADVFVSQSFTLASASSLEIKVDFGGRDTTSASGAGSFWQLFNSAGTVVATSPTTYAPATGTWVKSDVTPSTVFAPDTYTFLATLRNPDMLDAASVTTVPEPSTLVAAGFGLGLLCLVVSKRRQRSEKLG